MHCLVGLIGFFFPRLAIILIWLFSDYLGRAFSSGLWPLLGFFFAPFTTLAYAWAKNAHGSVDGMHLVVVIVAVLLDLGVIGGGARARRKARSR